MIWWWAVAKWFLGKLDRVNHQGRKGFADEPRIDSLRCFWSGVRRNGERCRRQCLRERLCMRVCVGGRMKEIEAEGRRR